MVNKSPVNTFSIQKTYKHLSGIINLKDKLEYLYKLKNDVINFEKSKGKIKLLSKADDRLFNEFKKDFFNLIANYEKARTDLKNNKTNNLTVRTKDDYIIWLGGKAVLTSLLKELIEIKCIANFDKSEVDTIILDHFYIEGYTKINYVNPKMIKWVRSYPLLLYLFEYLNDIQKIAKLLKYEGKIENVLHVEFYFSRHSLISKQFINKKEAKISNKVLARTELRYKKGDATTKPPSHEIIDGIIENVFFNKFTKAQNISSR